jgi:energy-coupling factor transport system substrate-specific component
MNTQKMVLASSLIALNVVLGKVAATLTLPVYLDSIGTILAGALMSWPIAVAVGVSTSAVAGLVIHPAYWYYFVTQAVIATVAVLLLRNGTFNRWWTAALGGLAIGLCAALVSAPVTAVVFGGVTLSGTTAINAILLASGQSLWKSVLGGSLLIESIDKVSAALIAWFVLRRLPSELLQTGQRAGR